MLLASLHGLKSGGLRGGGAAPPLCKHNARMMDFNHAYALKQNLHGKT